MREADVDLSPPKSTVQCWVGAPHYLGEKEHAGGPGQSKTHHLKVLCLWNLFPFLASNGLVDLWFPGETYTKLEVCRD